MDDPGSVELALGVAGGIFLAALFSATNAGLNALGDARLHAMEERGVLGAKRAIEEGDAIRTRLLLGRVLFIAIAAGCAALLAAQSRWWVALLAAAGAGLGYGALAEVASTIARRRAHRAALRMMRWMRPLEMTMAILAWPITAVGRLTARVIPEPAVEADVGALAVEHMIEQSEEAGEIAEEQAQLLYSVLEFQDTVAREVMVPRTQMVAFEVETSLGVVLDKIEESGHSRYPVYRETADHVEGILYAKDVFRLLQEGGDRTRSILELVRTPVPFVPEAQRIGVLLREMQAHRFHMAVVVDEFGGVSGVVTLEDIVEEIVGEIQDEHDDEDPEIEPQGEGVWHIDAAASVFEVQDATGLKLVEDEGSPDFDSIGGMLVHLAGDVPDVGATVDHEDVRLTVLEADDRHVTRVELSRSIPPEG